MKKKILCCLAAGVVFTSTIAIAANVNRLANNMIKIGAEEVRLENQMYIIDNKAYVPIRELAEKMKIPVLWNQEKNRVELLTDFKQISVDEGSVENEDGIIPNEETAYKVGKIILEQYMEESLEYETKDGTYYLKAIYHSLDNSWSISQQYQPKRGGGGGTGVYSPTIVLNKNTGEVMFIHTTSSFKE